MGFIQAFKGAIGGTFADSWLDFLTVPQNVPQTAALFQAVPRGTNANRGSNVQGSKNIITNGSKIVVPEGYGLITIEDGKATGLIAESGGYIFSSDEQNSQSFFSGGGFLNSTLRTSWERFRFGGQPGSQQLAFFVNLKEIPNNRFGTQSEIYWDDKYLNAQVGAVTRGVYSMQIVDPLLFVHNFVPALFISENAPVFDFSDMNNDAAGQLFNEVVASLAPAFSKYTNSSDKENRMSRIQSDSVGLAQSLSEAVEENYNWTSDRGLTVLKVSLSSIEYDADTRQLLSDVKKADALSGNRSASFLNQSVARGVEASGENGGSGMAMFGVGASNVGGLVQPVQQQEQQSQNSDNSSQNANPPATETEDPYEKLRKLKGLLDDGIISQDEFDAAKAKVLGL